VQPLAGEHDPGLDERLVVAPHLGQLPLVGASPASVSSVAPIRIITRIARSFTSPCRHASIERGSDRQPTPHSVGAPPRSRPRRGAADPRAGSQPRRLGSGAELACRASEHFLGVA
jgi:hypothetical protein